MLKNIFEKALGFLSAFLVAIAILFFSVSFIVKSSFKDIFENKQNAVQLVEENIIEHKKILTEYRQKTKTTENLLGTYSLIKYTNIIPVKIKGTFDFSENIVTQKLEVSFLGITIESKEAQSYYSINGSTIDYPEKENQTITEFIFFGYDDAFNIINNNIEIVSSYNTKDNFIFIKEN